MSLNVNGLCSKLKYEDLEDHIGKFDIIGLSETKLDDCDHVEIDNFELFTKNQKKFKSRSGGVALLVSNNIVQHVKIIQSDCESVLWFHISENLLGYTLFGGVIYIPPEGSKYSDIELFDQIENELIELKRTNSQICIFGDMNARTGILNDFTSLSDNIESSFIYDEDSDETNLSDLGYPIKRTSKDKTTNNYGFKLVDLCKSNSLYIVNG